MVELKSIEKVFKQRNWWDLLINLKVAKYITYFVANYTKLTPNNITFISFIFAFFALIAISSHHYIFGAILFQISYIFDIVDGALARVKNLTSKFGAFLDVFTDWFKAPILITILLYQERKIESLIAILMLLFWNCVANKYNDMLFFTTKKSLTTSKEVKSSKIGRYFEFMKEKHLIALPGIVEFEALVLFFYPIFLEDLFLYLGILLLLFNFVLKVYAISKKLKS